MLHSRYAFVFRFSLFRPNAIALRLFAASNGAPLLYAASGVMHEIKHFSDFYLLCHHFVDFSPAIDAYCSRRFIFCDDQIFRSASTIQPYKMRPLWIIRLHLVVEVCLRRSLPLISFTARSDVAQRDSLWLARSTRLFNTRRRWNALEMAHATIPQC